jgi:hypothetical protein
MSKHLRALGKLKKNVLGLSTTNLDTEITSLGARRDKLPTLIYEKTDEATAAEVLSNMVDKYHLKEASLVERIEKDGSVRLGFPSSMELTTFIDAINVELSAKCETQTVIDSAKRKVAEFFSVKEGGFMEPIGGGGIDGTTTSSILNYQKFNSNSYNYVDNSKYLDFINLVEKGDLKIEFSDAVHTIGKQYTYTLVSDKRGKLTLKYVVDEETGDESLSYENFIIVPTDKENVFNFIDTEVSKDPLTTITFDGKTELFNDFETTNSKGVTEKFSLVFSSAFELIGGINKVPTEKSFQVVEKLALTYRDTYIKNYTEYLPDFAQLKYFLNQNLEYEFGKYEAREALEGSRGEELSKDVSEIEKLKSNYTQFTNDIIDELTYLFYGTISKSDRINTIERYRKNISIAVLNLGTQNDNSKNILRTYGEGNLIVVKEALNSLNKETTLQSEKTIISEVEVERREQTEDLEEILGGVDTTFIDKAGLSDGSIISAKSAHTETLKIYSGARVDKIIKEAIDEGKFEVEVFELTDIEAKLLLVAGYYIKETTEVNVIDPNNKSGGRREEILTTWTINWESANSVTEEKPLAAPGGPIGLE